MSGRDLMISGLFKLFPDDATAAQSFVERRWPDGCAARYVGPTMCRTARPTEVKCGNEHR